MIRKCVRRRKFSKKSLLRLKQQTRRFEAGEDAEVRGERGGERGVRADTEKLLGAVRGHRRRQHVRDEP